MRIKALFDKEFWYLNNFTMCRALLALTFLALTYAICIYLQKTRGSNQLTFHITRVVGLISWIIQANFRVVTENEVLWHVSLKVEQ